MKLRTNVAVAAILGLVAGGLVYAGTNWSTSTGGGWSTPNDTTAIEGDFLVVGSSAVNPSVSTTGQPRLQNRTLAQINASTAAAIGQLVFCSDCVQSRVCVSTGTAGISQWVVIGSSAPANTIVSCR